jgi:hypothetical protein
MEINNFELIWGAMPTFACKNRAKWENLLGLSGLQAKIKARDLSNMKREC